MTSIITEICFLIKPTLLNHLNPNFLLCSAVKRTAKYDSSCWGCKLEREMSEMYEVKLVSSCKVCSRFVCTSQNDTRPFSFLWSPSNLCRALQFSAEDSADRKAGVMLSALHIQTEDIRAELCTFVKDLWGQTQCSLQGLGSSTEQTDHVHVRGLIATWPKSFPAKSFVFILLNEEEEMSYSWWVSWSLK